MIYNALTKESSSREKYDYLLELVQVVYPPNARMTIADPKIYQNMSWEIPTMYSMGYLFPTLENPNGSCQLLHKSDIRLSEALGMDNEEGYIAARCAWLGWTFEQFDKEVKRLAVKAIAEKTVEKMREVYLIP